MSSVMQKGLPRPSIISKDLFSNDQDESSHYSKAEQLVREEMLILMAHDNKHYPLKAMKASQLPRLNREKTQYTLD